jgi:hypothetical protein
MFFTYRGAEYFVGESLTSRPAIPSGIVDMAENSAPD